MLEDALPSPSMLLLFLTVASLVVSSWGTIIGVDIAVQQLFNSSGTTYATAFTRDVVPVHYSIHKG